MPIIRPISDLRNNAAEISTLCHEADQPVFITKNGKGDMVVMSQAHFERMDRRLELYMQLAEAESLDAMGEKGVSHRTLMEQLRTKVENASL